MTWSYQNSFKVAAPPAQLFAALISPSQLRRWFAEHADVETRVGGRYHFWGRHTIGAPVAADSRQRITRFEAGLLLAYQWPLWGIESEVTAVVSADSQGSSLGISHSVEGKLPVPREKELIEDHWRLSHGNLSEHLTGGTGILLPDYTDPAPEIRQTIMIDAPPATVWRALIEPAAINRWFGTDSAIVEPQVGGRYDLNWSYKVDGRDVHGGPTRILELRPDELLILDWPDWRGDSAVPVQKISFRLEPVDGGTRVTFVHSGFTRASDVGDYPFGWAWFMGELVKEATAVRG